MAVTMYLVRNAILPYDDKKLNNTTTFDLNSFARSIEYTAIDFLALYSFVNMQILYVDVYYAEGIGARAAISQRTLTIEGVLTTTRDMLNCRDYNLALGIITTLSGDQANLTKLKEDLRAKKKLSANMEEDVARLEANKTRLLCKNIDMECNFKTKENDLNKENINLKEELDQEKQPTKYWRPEIELAINMMKHLLLIGDDHNKVYVSFTP